jgi:hypothetical protein
MLGFGPLAELNFEPATDLSGPLHFHTHCAATPVGTVVSPLIAHLPPAIYGNIPIYLGAVLPLLEICRNLNVSQHFSLVSV